MLEWFHCVHDKRFYKLAYELHLKNYKKELLVRQKQVKQTKKFEKMM
jgi:hypothetical protein